MVEEAGVTQVHLRCLHEPFPHAAMVGCQAPDEERLLEHVEVALDGVVRDAEGLAERGRVQQPPLCVRQHGEEATEQEGIGPDAELREVALDVRPEVPLPPVAEVAAECTGKPAAQPERRPGAPRRSRARLRSLIHGSRRWATASFDPAATEPPAEGCAGALFPWTQLVLDPAGVVRKAALIEVYRTQVGRSRRLLRYARRAEPFARGEIIVGRRSMSHTRPGVTRTRDGIVIRLPRAGCGIDPLAGDRVRFRFSRAGVLEERLVHLRGATGAPMAGRAGQPTQVATDVRVEVDERSIRLHLAADPFFTVPGIFVEVLPPDDARVGAAWAFLCSSHPAADPSGGPPR